MSLLFKVLFLFICSEFLYPGTVYLSKSIDELSSTQIGSGDLAVQTDGLEFSSHTLGYYDTVWEKRKIKNYISLGVEFLHSKSSRGDFNLVTFYSMFNYKHSKKIISTLYVGIDFFNNDFILNNQEIYKPDAKGGPMYGLGLAYMFNKKFPLSMTYKVYTFSVVDNDSWIDESYSRASISLGYKF